MTIRAYQPSDQRGVPMRFLIYGAGVIGSVFACRLANAGHCVTMLARGERLTQLRQQGVVLRHALSGKTERAAVRVIDCLDPDDLYDYILVTMQFTQADAVLPVLAANRSPNVVFIVNNPSGYDRWADKVGASRLLIGFPSAGGEQQDGIVTCYIGRGLARVFQTTTFGEYNGALSPRVKALARAFTRAGIPSALSRDMDAWQKTHTAVVTAIANALYQHGSDNAALARSYPDLRLMTSAIREGLAVLSKLGVTVTPSKLNYLRLPAWLTACVFKSVMGTKLAEIAMARHTAVAREEMRALQGAFDGLIEKSGLRTPFIDRLRHFILE